MACQVWVDFHIDDLGGIVVFDEGYYPSSSPFLWGFATMVHVVFRVVPFDLFQVIVHA